MTLLTQELIEQLDEAIENVKELIAERDQLRADKAELVAALEAALPLVEGFDDADTCYDDDEEPIVAPVLAMIRAALAKHKEG